MGNKQWTKELVLKKALMHKSRGDFYKLNGNAYEWARSRELLDEICIHMKPLTIKWTEVTALKEASKYHSRTALAKGASGAYEYLKRNDLLTSLYGEATNKKKEWDLNTALNIAKNYTSRKLFQLEHCSLYRWIGKNNLLDVVFKHIPARNVVKYKGTMNKSGVYILKYNNKVVYVGRALTCVHSRLMSHHRDEDKVFDEIDVYISKNLSDVAILEIYLICRYQPEYNKDSTSSFIPSLIITNYEDKMEQKLQYKNYKQL